MIFQIFSSNSSFFNSIKLINSTNSFISSSFVNSFIFVSFTNCFIIVNSPNYFTFMSFVNFFTYTIFIYFTLIWDIWSTLYSNFNLSWQVEFSSNPTFTSDILFLVLKQQLLLLIWDRNLNFKKGSIFCLNSWL